MEIHTRWAYLLGVTTHAGDSGLVINSRGSDDNLQLSDTDGRTVGPDTNSGAVGRSLPRREVPGVGGGILDLSQLNGRQR